jgi:DNA-binding response OmpR family regulator
MLQTCLIAAHDPWFIQLLKAYSEESGFRVVQAFESQDVLPIIQAEKPVVIFLQIDLPGQVQSKDVLHLVKAEPAMSNIPVLVFSWQGNECGDIQGATAQLQEPVTYEAFIEALNKAGIFCRRNEKTGDLLPYSSHGNKPAEPRKLYRKKKGQV